MQVHVTSLTRINKCPADYMYNKSEILLKNTYKGDVLNTAVNSMWALWPWVKWYAENIDSDFAEIEKLKKVILDARAYAFLRKKEIEGMIEQWVEGVWYWQETKMVIPYSDDYDIVGSVDFLYNKWEWFVVEDFKYSTHSRYSKEEILAKDCQRVVYPLMVMNYFWVDKVMFRFKVWDKKNTKLKDCGEMMMVKSYCEDYLHDVMDRFDHAYKNNLYPNCNSHNCFYCGPMMRNKKTVDNDFVF